MESGYIMIDCKGFDLLSESAVTIDGLFDRLTEAMKTGKVVIAHNLEWDGEKTSPCPVFVTKPDARYCCTAATLQIWVTNEDSVSVVNLAQSNEGGN